MTQWGHCVLANKRLPPVLSGRTHFKMAASQVSFEEKMVGIRPANSHGLTVRLTRFGISAHSLTIWPPSLTVNQKILKLPNNSGCHMKQLKNLC